MQKFVFKLIITSLVISIAIGSLYHLICASSKDSDQIIIAIGINPDTHDSTIQLSELAKNIAQLLNKKAILKLLPVEMTDLCLEIDYCDIAITPLVLDHDNHDNNIPSNISCNISRVNLNGMSCEISTNPSLKENVQKVLENLKII